MPLIFSAHQAIQSATLTVNEIIFEPKNLIQLLAQNALLSERDEGVTITTDHANEVVPLLRAALADWVDFLFVPTPKPFVIYADHDEFVTFYANTKSNLNHTVGPLEAHGYKAVQDWQREF